MTDSIEPFLNRNLRAASEALQELAAGTPSAAQIYRLRNDFGESITHRLLEVAGLQHRARKKLGAGVWWVTDRSLQQATPWQVASLKAGWFADARVHDLCCGIGGDSVRLAERGEVVGIDIDPLLLAFAQANAVNADSEATVDFRCRDVCSLTLNRKMAIHIDPDRRVGGKRSSDPHHYRPDWNQLLTMLPRSGSAVIKLAPAARVPEDAPPGHRCWISLSGTVREQAWLHGGALERSGLAAGQRSAISLDRRGRAAQFAAPSDVSLNVTEVSQPLGWLIDPDAAIRAAGLTASFADRFALGAIGGPAGFLTAEQKLDDEVAAFAVVNRVRWRGSADDRKLRAAMRKLDARPVTVKIRGVDRSPADLVRRFRKSGRRPVKLWIGRTHERVYAAITDASDAEPSDARRIDC